MVLQGTAACFRVNLQQFHLLHAFLELGTLVHMLSLPPRLLGVQSEKVKKNIILLCKLCLFVWQHLVQA